MTQQHRSFWLTSKGLAALGFIGAVSYFLLVEHRQHVWEFLPYLIFLACPFMHLFMHGGHGNHGDNDHSSDVSEQDAFQRGLKEGRRENEHRHHH